MSTKTHLKAVFCDATLQPEPCPHLSTETCVMCGSKKKTDRFTYDLWLNSIQYETRLICRACSDRIEGNRARDEKPLGGFYE